MLIAVVKHGVRVTHVRQAVIMDAFKNYDKMAANFAILEWC